MHLALRIVRTTCYLALSSAAFVSSGAASFHPAGDETTELVVGSPAQGVIKFTHDGITSRVTRGWPQPVLTFRVQAANGTDAPLGVRSLDLWLVTDAGTVLSDPQLRQDSVVVDRVDVDAGDDTQFEATFYLGPTGPFDAFTLYWGARLGDRVLHGTIVYEADDDSGYRPPEPSDGSDTPSEEFATGAGEDGAEARSEADREYGDTYVYNDGYGSDYYPRFTFGVHYGYHPYGYYPYSYGYYPYWHHSFGHHHDGHQVDHHDRDGVTRRTGSRATRDRARDGRRGTVTRNSTRSRDSTARGRISRSSTRSSRGSVRSSGQSGSRSSATRPSSRGSSRSSGARVSSRGSRGGSARSSRGGSRGSSRGGGRGRR